MEVKKVLFRNIVKKMSEKAEVENSHPHKFRRTFGCTMLDYSDLVTVQTLMEVIVLYLQLECM